MAELPIDRQRSAWLFVTIGLRVLLAGVFAFAAVMKLYDLNAFAYEVRQYRVIPDAWSVVVANIVPWFELVVSGLLLAGVWRAETRIMFFLMIIGFTALKVSAELRGLKITCGCFGSGNALSEALAAILKGWRGVVLNVVLLTLLALESFGTWRLARMARTPRRPTGDSAEPIPHSKITSPTR